MKYVHKYGVELEGLLKKTAKNKVLLRELLSDLLSPAEYKDLAVRWQIVKQLQKGLPQRDIAKNLKVSISTVTRGSREMMNKNGGFVKVLKKYYSKHIN
jgi:TrpR family trp operon transcriptional repressor